MNKKLKVFVCHSDKTLPNEGKTYYTCSWVQFEISPNSDKLILIWDFIKGEGDVLQETIYLDKVEYFDIFEINS